MRDFVYLDTEKLCSLYSQVFEGVVDHIIESSAFADSRSDLQKGQLLSGASTESRLAEASFRSESKVLHDCMYQRLEARIAGSFVTGNQLSADRLRDRLGTSFLIKVAGSAEIEDYDRMKLMLDKFNQLGEAIAYSFAVGLHPTIVEAEKEKLKSITDRNEKARAESRLRNLTLQALAKEIATEKGLKQDEGLLKNLDLMASVFHPNAYEVTIVPNVDGPAFRAVLNKRWLRVEPDYLSALYGGFVEGNWTMVGQVTHIPGGRIPQPETNAVETTRIASESDSETEPSMRDPFRQMFWSARVLERIFLESKTRTEIVVSPIAIYREMTLDMTDARAEATR